jgi:hypothetical protein
VVDFELSKDGGKERAPASGNATNATNNQCRTPNTNGPTPCPKAEPPLPSPADEHLLYPPTPSHRQIKHHQQSWHEQHDLEEPWQNPPPKSP